MRGRSLWPTLFGLFLIACGLLQILFIAMMVGKAYLPWTTWGIADTWAIPGLCIGIGVLSLAAGVSQDRIDRRPHARRCRGHCTNCDYKLTGLAEPRCPECGQAFEPKGDAV